MDAFMAMDASASASASPEARRDADKTSVEGDGGPSPAMKRLACEACRYRKIRCDRQHPTCGRCAKMGNACRYSLRSKSTPSKTDLSRYLLAMSQRLQQTEAQLAYQSMQITTSTASRDHQGESSVATAQTFSPGLAATTLPFQALATAALSSSSSSSNADSGLLPPPLDFQNLGVITEDGPSDNSSSEWSVAPGTRGNEFVDFNVDFNIDTFMMPVGQNTSQFMPETSQPSLFSPMLTDTALLASDPDLPGLSSGLLHGLYDRYFELFHPTLPMISRSRFEAETSQPSPPIGVRALSWVIATLGAFSIPELRCHVDRCYEQCRALLELCERDDTGGSLASLNTLQALVLLTLYECKQPNLARSWMTLGRAIRLAKMMGLDQGACCLSGVAAAAQWVPALPPPTTCAEAEERRRTYWVIFILDAFSAMQTNARLALEKPTEIPLPHPHDYPDELIEPGALMPSLYQVFNEELSDQISVSPFAGTVIVVWLYRRCLDHMSLQPSPASYDSAPSFWENHYSVEKVIKLCQTKMLARYIDGDRVDDPRSLILRMTLAAVEVMLHETALAKIEAGKLPAALEMDAISKCAAAATDIAKAVQMGKSLVGKRLEIFRQQDRFLVWPMTTAILVLGSLLERQDELDDGTAGYRFALRVLCRAMRDLTRPDHLPAGLMDKVDAWLAEEKFSSPETDDSESVE
ncbi:hypothetical protein S7711_01582 [Stachybotrys chartarum IBT 7711]|uniref:Zn(2)-C6 fungal-type domain-containing protein n=1 Tax=Stachybotrys chartarum (strain CBS 109288 / IBT 7711) TaxID=1280523 RepID=A0A084BC51_STACB|nr:hypothetical protein S7711_01582 [Stachybotrys chartarum IBT 7711]KFA49122.1 hypothetical protein S40293_07091 [Stachybotrys chartarum IBT 40293]